MKKKKLQAKKPSKKSLKRKRKNIEEKVDSLTYSTYESQISKLRTASSYFEFTIHASIMSDILNVSSSKPSRTKTFVDYKHEKQLKSKQISK